MSAELQHQIEGQSPQIIELGPICAIGRGPSNDVVVNDTRASRNHAVIRMQGDHVYVLLDLGSSNGTMLNNRRVSIPSPLKSGDEITIANNRFIFINKLAPEAAPAEEDLDMRTQMEFKSETVSILVVDIRNYTGLSESIPAEDLSRIVGKWFQEASAIIDKHGGHIDKFIGDAVMAYWKRGSNSEDKAYLHGAIHSAIQLVELAKVFHKQVSELYPKFNFHIGCGINSGRAILGTVGESTLVGDSVNVAFRLESLCKELEHPIILSEEVKLAAGAEFKYVELGAQRVKGKSNEIHVFTIPL